MRHEQLLNAKFSNFLNNFMLQKAFFHHWGNMHWNRICYGTRLICHTTICWFIRTRNLRKDNICKGAQLLFEPNEWSTHWQCVQRRFCSKDAEGSHNERKQKLRRIEVLES